MRFHRITNQERHLYQPGIVAIEKTATYPLGDDFFQIDHGSDYFAFFDRLGKVNYYVMCDREVSPMENRASADLSVSENITAVGAGVLRQIPYQQGSFPKESWYLCDLKVHPNYQKRHLSLRILSQAIYDGIRECASGYLISMNPGDGSSNRLVQILERYSLVKFTTSSQLGIYSLDAATMSSIAPLIKKYRGDISYLSLQGIKDLRLRNTNNTLPLVHVQWGASVNKGMSEVIPGYTHMFCIPSSDEFARILAQKAIFPNATASIVSHGMDHSDWRFILTSDI